MRIPIEHVDDYRGLYPEGMAASVESIFRVDKDGNHLEVDIHDLFDDDDEDIFGPPSGRGNHGTESTQGSIITGSCDGKRDNIS